MTADEADRARPRRAETGENDKVRYSVTWSPGPSSDEDRTKALEALKEFVRALARRQAQLDFEEEQEAKRRTRASDQKVRNDNLYETVSSENGFVDDRRNYSSPE